MNFEVNGQAYFLNFSERHGQWFVIKPTNAGVVALPVYVDEKEIDRIELSLDASTGRVN